jgi:hypothetical protein
VNKEGAEKLYDKDSEQHGAPPTDHHLNVKDAVAHMNPDTCDPAHPQGQPSPVHDPHFAAVEATGPMHGSASFAHAPDWGSQSVSPSIAQHESGIPPAPNAPDVHVHIPAGVHGLQGDFNLGSSPVIAGNDNPHGLTSTAGIPHVDSVYASHDAPTAGGVEIGFLALGLGAGFVKDKLFGSKDAEQSPEKSSAGSEQTRSEASSRPPMEIESSHHLKLPEQPTPAMPAAPGTRMEGAPQQDAPQAASPPIPPAPGTQMQGTPQQNAPQQAAPAIPPTPDARPVAEATQPSPAPAGHDPDR